MKKNKSTVSNIVGIIIFGFLTLSMLVIILAAANSSNTEDLPVAILILSLLVLGLIYNIFAICKASKSSQNNKQITTVSNSSNSYLLNNISVRGSKPINISEYELQFFLALEKQLKLKGFDLAQFSAERMSSGTIRLNHIDGIVGNVHLRKQLGCSIQYFITPMKWYDMNEAPIEAVIAVIPYWITYAENLVKLKKAVLTP